ncbi:MAG: translation initiation factor IF-3 [Acidobacteriota bacterium]
MRRRRRGFMIPPRKQETTRVNDRIRKSPVRLIDADGTQVGIIELSAAKARAQEQNLDLVEVGASADPPVVKIMDWGKTRFEREKRARESKKKAQTIEVKEVKFRPTIDEHDFHIKLKRAIRFLDSGKKVKITVFFRLRQLRRPELGIKILDNVEKGIVDVAEIESRSRLEGRQMTMILAPLPPKVRKANKERRAEEEALARGEDPAAAAAAAAAAGEEE